MEYQKEYAVTMSKVGKGKYQYRQKYPDPLLSNLAYLGIQNNTL